MQTILTVVHLLLAVGLIGLILLQHGKGADAGAAFGSGASATVFGARGSGSFLTRTTAVLATLFFLTSIALAYYATKVGEPQGLMDAVETEVPVAIPELDEQPEVQEDLARRVSDLPALPEEAGVADGGSDAAGLDVPKIPDDEARLQTDDNGATSVPEEMDTLGEDGQDDAPGVAAEADSAAAGHRSGEAVASDEHDSDE